MQRGPALQPGVMLIEQRYRGEQSFVLKDPVTRKYFRFRPAEAAVLRAFDGTRTIEEIAGDLAERGLATTAAAVEGFARTLSRMGLLERTLAERTRHQLERLRTERRRQRSLFRGEWLRMRWSFGDVDRWYTAAMPYFRWCFTRWFVTVSVALFVAYAAVLAARWGEFTAALGTTFAPGALTGGGIAVLLVVLFALTLVHELGHGFACKYHGGEVREMGFMLLYFTPSFYCNVNDAWSFPDRRARLWVTAAGSWIETVVTGVAALAWVVVSPGTLASDLALATMLIGGFMAVGTNANPLMPLDGYFALADWLEIPNLRHRASAHLAWWFQRHVLRLDLPEPDVAPAERRLLLGYGALALGFAVVFLGFVVAVVLGWATDALGAVGAGIVVLGLVLVLWNRIVSFVRGTLQAARAQLGGHRTRRWRRRAPAVLAGLLLVMAILPWPLRTSGPFVVAPRRATVVVATDSGVVEWVAPAEGEVVAAGAPVIGLLGLDLARALAGATREADSLRLREQAARAVVQPGTAALLAAERTRAAAEATRLREQLAGRVLRARSGGTVMTRRPELLVGHWVEPGDTLLEVADLAALEARIALRVSGSTRVMPGQPVELIAHQAANAPLRGVVREVASAGTGRGALEVRVDLPPGTRLPAGSVGEGRVEWGRSSVLGALWWAARSRIRGDLLL